MANWVNEGLVNINNKYKGKAHIPTKVIPVPDDFKAQYKNTIAAMWMKRGKGFYLDSTLIVNVDYFNNAHKSIGEYLKCLNFKSTPRADGGNDVQMKFLPFFSTDKQMNIMQQASKFATGKATKMDIVSLKKAIADYFSYDDFVNEKPMVIINDVYSQKGVVDLLKKYMKQGSFKSVEELEKISKNKQVDYLREAFSTLSANSPLKQVPSSKILAAKRSVWDTLYHEEGHLFHKKNTILDYDDMRVIYNKQTKEPEKIGALAKDFLKNKDEQFIASTVSGYAQRSPLEFVAEVYASMLNGEKFGADVMNLYNKYQGSVLPA